MANSPERFRLTQDQMDPCAFHWQVPPTPSAESQRKALQGPMSVRTWTELDDELRANERRRFDEHNIDSIHTEFQEHREESAADAGVDEYDPPDTVANRGYMQRSSPFSLLPALINDKSFLEWFPKGDATLSFPDDDGGIASINGVNLWMIEERCALLSTAFEPSRSGPQLHLETLTPATATPFLRYLYTGTYALASASGDYYEDVPTSVLLHCQLFRLGDIYDLHLLKRQSYVNVLRQCEFGCSSPHKPIDLCAAIRYTYEHLREHDNLIEAILSYCMSCFLSHRLAQDEEFKQLAFELRPFHQELCRMTMNREFEDDTATAIIQMPFKPFVPETYASREEPGNARLEDVVYHFHTEDQADTSPKKRKRIEPVKKRIEPVPPPSRISNLTLALRPRVPAPEAANKESASEDEGFQIVKRRASSDAGATNPFSDTEFEILPGTAPVETVSSDSDSDTDTVLEMKRTVPSASNASRALSIRTRNTAIFAAMAARSNSSRSSDSDWDLV